MSAAEPHAAGVRAAEPCAADVRAAEPHAADSRGVAGPRRASPPTHPTSHPHT